MKSAKLKKCKNCGSEFEPFQTTQKVCGHKCAYELVQKDRDKAENKALRQRKKDFHGKDRAKQLKLTQAAFNKMRVLEEKLWFRERNIEPYCISCGKSLGGDQWCCGHLKTVGSNSQLRFDRKNTFLQHNHRCNKQLSGDIGGTKTTHGYKAGLISRFGEIEGQEIIDYCELRHENKKWTPEELQEMRSEFNKKIREISILLD